MESQKIWKRLEWEVPREVTKSPVKPIDDRSSTTIANRYWPQYWPDPWSDYIIHSIFGESFMICLLMAITMDSLANVLLRRFSVNFKLFLSRILWTSWALEVHCGILSSILPPIPYPRLHFSHSLWLWLCESDFLNDGLLHSKKYCFKRSLLEIFWN